MAKQDERQIRICSNQKTNRRVPELRLTGVWFEELGFNIGDRVNITARERLLVIQPIKTEPNGNTGN